MCALTIIADSRPAFGAGRVTAIALSALATAAAALAGFGLAHAILITPIWDKLLRGAPFVIVGGAALATAFDQVVVVTRDCSIKRGAQFGTVMFLALVPATALDTALRLTGLRRADAFETAIAMLLALLCGAIAGWVWTRQRSGAAAFSAGALGLMIATAGPLPVAQSAAGLWLSVAIAMLAVGAGVVLAVVRRTLGAGAS